MDDSIYMNQCVSMILVITTSFRKRNATIFCDSEGSLMYRYCECVNRSGKVEIEIDQDGGIDSTSLPLYLSLVWVVRVTLE